MSRENEPASAIPHKQQSQVVREKNLAVFRNFKHKLGDVQSNLDKWLKVTGTFRDFVRDARIYYDEARPDIIDCVQIATNAVLWLLPAELRHIRPVNWADIPGVYQMAYEELRRLLVIVGSYQPEIINPHKGGEPRHDLLSRLTGCIAAFGIEPDSLLDKTSLQAAMRTVNLDDKSQQTIFASIARRRVDALSVVSSARATPSIATPVLSLASPHTSASPQAVAPANHTAHPGPPQIQTHYPAAPAIAQAVPSPTVPGALASPVRQTHTDAPKPRKPKWMTQDLDEFREKKKMAKPGVANVVPVSDTSVTAATSQSPSIAAPIPPSTIPPSTQPSNSYLASSTPTTIAEAKKAASAAIEYAMEVDAKLSGGMEVEDTLEAMDIDVAPLDSNAPLPYTLPPGVFSPCPPEANWGDLFAEAINASHDHKLTISQIIQYVSTVYPGLKGTRHAAGAMFNSKVAKQTGRGTLLQGTVTGELRVHKYSKKGSRFVRVSNVFPHTWTLDEGESNATTSPQLLGAANQAIAQDKAATSHEDSATNDAPPDLTQDVPIPDTTPPALHYTLPPGPYSSDKPSKTLTELVQEAILAGTPEKHLTQPDIISYILTAYPFYSSQSDLENEVSDLLRQHFAPKADGPQTWWSLWIRDGSDEERTLPYVLPSGPRSTSKPDRSLQELIQEAILASPEHRITERNVAAYVLSVAPYYNGDEALPIGQLLGENFVTRGSDAEGHVLWGVKGDEDLTREESMHTGNVETPVTPSVAQDESGAPSARPLNYNDPPKIVDVVESGEGHQSNLETSEPITPLTASTAFPSPVIENVLPSGEAPSAPVKAARRSNTRSLVPQPFVLPPGPYSLHKPPQSNAELIIEALLASPTHQLQKKDIVVYLQTVYPWFRRDESTLTSCKRMVEAQVARLTKKERVTRVGMGIYALNDSTSTSGAPTPFDEVEDEDMDDVPRPRPSAPNSIGSRPPSGAPALTIRIPARPPASGDASSSASHKRSAPSPSPIRSRSPSIQRKVTLIVRDKNGAISPPRAKSNGDVSAQVTASSNPSSPGHAPEPVAARVEAVASIEEQAPDVQMQDAPDIAQVPDLPPLPPVSFGQEACLVDVAFGRPGAGSFALHIHPLPQQWDLLERWRNAARNDDSVSDALCYSLACYRSEDVHMLKEDVAADAWADALARTEIPVSLHNEALRSLCLTGNGRTVPFPLTWMTATASPLFLDISSYLVPGDNVLTLTHTADISSFTFAIVAHRPNPHQLRWLDTRREPWRRFQAQLNQSLQVPELDYEALLLSSRDTSKVKLDCGVPQELLAIS